MNHSFLGVNNTHYPPETEDLNSGCRRVQLYSYRLSYQFYWINYILLFHKVAEDPINIIFIGMQRIKGNLSGLDPQTNRSLQFPNIHGQTKKNKQQRKQKVSKPIVFNLADTQYEIIEAIGEQLNWKIQYNDSRNWDVKWHDCAITIDTLSKMKTHQKINHFPGMNSLHRKNNLAKNLYRMQQENPKDYDFFPKTFLLPMDYYTLKRYSQQLRKLGIAKTFIVKPEANCQGRGIFLTQDINEILQYDNCIVQKYIANPLLFQGLKFDFRIYALVSGCDPLRIHIYNEGLVRFATEKYQYPDEDNMSNLYMHLTNYAINKTNPKYIFNDSLKNLSYGHKQSLAEFFQTLKGMGLKAHEYWSDIKDIIIKTLISGQPHLQHQYRMGQPHNIINNMCFEILGFDFMIDKDNKVYLLEINHTPSFATKTPIDQLIKSNLIKDTLNILNITPKSRQEAINAANEIQKTRVFTGKQLKLSANEREARAQQFQKLRNEYEKANLGSYERIYPTKIKGKQEKYLKLLQSAKQKYLDMTFNTNNRGSPNKFRIKRISTHHKQDDEQQPQTNPEENTIKNRSYANSRSLKPRGQKKINLLNQQPISNATISTISKKFALETNNQQSTMFIKNNQFLASKYNRK